VGFPDLPRGRKGESRPIVLFPVYLSRSQSNECDYDMLNLLKAPGLLGIASMLGKIAIGPCLRTQLSLKALVSITYVFGYAWAMSALSILVAPNWSYDEDWQFFLHNGAVLDFDMPCLIFSTIHWSPAMRPINAVLAGFIFYKIAMFFLPDISSDTVVIVLIGSFLNTGCLVRLIYDFKSFPFRFSTRSILLGCVIVSIVLGLLRSFAWTLVPVAVPFALIILPWGIWNSFYFYANKPLSVAITFHLWRNFWWTALGGITGGEQAWQSSLRETLMMVDVPLRICTYIFAGVRQNSTERIATDQAFYASLCACSIWLISIYTCAYYIKRRRLGSNLSAKNHS